ncbi:isoaspartyl peptidase/L-asparaginase family protein [Vulgatibacter sp.]|uniref:isoaspartyl peptidase/L-asparaginase family protein n=1 Tax=Vulgatibacter sp. TaxID=1971226 RepID=UPI0035682703
MPTAILVHGGAGAIFPDDRAHACARGCLEAARAGHRILAAGGSALDAAVAACVVLEDDPAFNAGTGSVLNADGEVEMDACLMDGSNLRAGAVAAIRGVRNPIEVARLVLERSPHVLLAGSGAERFARAQGVAPWPASLLVTERALTRWQKERDEGWTNKPGTVGAVAVDAQGHVAAATSTGGISSKHPGRVGDSPLPGAGTYADDETGAVSATGQGEAIIRVVLAKFACDQLAAGDHPQAAAEAAVRRLGRVQGEGGLVVVDRQGRIGLAANTARMSRGWVDAEGNEGCAFEG